MPSSHLVPPARPVAADPAVRSGPPGAALQPALDAAALARLAELDPTGDTRLIERVLRTFQTSAVKFAAQLEAARATGDREAIRLVAHTLKSSSGYIGALELVRCCAELEAACLQAAHRDLNREIDAMTGALALALAAVSRRLDTR